ncbi:MAG TPA: DUF3159 domain-containing protein [Actinomycetospora sp.]|nr:DUF3159 domain-containing protein [Actinomycetospora sp.]
MLRGGGTSGHAGRRRVTGVALSAVPPAVVAPAAQLAGLGPGVLCGLLAAGLVAPLAARRGLGPQPVIGGLVGVGVSGGLAWWGGSPADAFLADIGWAAAASVVLAASLVVGRPLVGVAWGLTRGTPVATWRGDRRARCAFTLATAALATIAGARFAVQSGLHRHDAVWALTAGRLGLGLPLTLVGLAVVGWAVARVERRLRPGAPRP